MTICESEPEGLGQRRECKKKEKAEKMGEEGRDRRRSRRRLSCPRGVEIGSMTREAEPRQDRNTSAHPQTNRQVSINKPPGHRAQTH